MNEMNLKRQIEILNNLNFSNGYYSRNSVSDILLFREFLARLKKRKLNFHVDEKNKTRKNSLNVFTDISLENDPLPNSLDNLEKFEKELIKASNNETYISGRSYIGLILYLDFLSHFYENKSKQHIQVKNLYEPLIKILERGGSLFFRDGKFHINGIEYNKKDKWISLPSVENDFLKFVDDSCEIYPTNAQSKLYSKIPNQEETNKLWEIFNQNKIK